jgi:hypothetical protein
MVLAWSIPDPIGGGFWLENPSRSGGVAQNGQEQNVVSLAMRQRAQWTVPLRNANQITNARRMFAHLQGKAGSLLVPVFEPTFGRTAVVVHGPFAARVTELDITLTAGPAPEEGRHFSIGSRAYLIRDVTDLTLGNWRMTFFPPLRATATAGDAVRFDTAACEMNLVENETPILLDVMRYAMLDLSFVEAF